MSAYHPCQDVHLQTKLNEVYITGQSDEEPTDLEKDIQYTIVAPARPIEIREADEHLQLGTSTATSTHAGTQVSFWTRSDV